MGTHVGATGAEVANIRTDDYGGRRREFRRLLDTCPGTRFSSELDLLVGGRDRWTGQLHRALCQLITTA